MQSTVYVGSFVGEIIQIMKPREALFLLIVVAGLLLTGNAFLKQSSFDCYQPLFSSQSSCSLAGGGCIKIHAQAGVGGLWDEFKHLIVRKTDTGIRIECAPNCYVDVDSEDFVQSDSVNQQQE